MKVVVTGATGHLGCELVARLAHDGHEVVAASRSGRLPVRPFGAPPPAAGERVRALGVDLAQDASIAILRGELGPEVALVHLAAWHPPATAATGPSDRRQLLEVNVHGTMRLLEAARVSSGGVGCVVYASTFEVYAELAAGGAELTESARLAPRTDYGVSKLSGEDHLLSFAYEEQTRVVALRMPAVYGPGEHTPRALPNFLRAVARGERPVIFGDGADLRDQLHVRDAAEALVLAAVGRAHGIFNVADGAGHSIAEFARLALDLGELGGGPEQRPRTKPRCDYHMSIALARAQLGFSPRVELRAGMAEELAWIRSLSAA